MSRLEALSLRFRRKRLLARALWRRRALQPLNVKADKLRGQPILLFAAVYNERIRLPYFLQYYRDLGIDHFIIVDNASDDGSRGYLVKQPDVSLWTTSASYSANRYGMDWITALQYRYGHNRWCLTVDVDEFLIYPFCETRPLRALTDWLDTSGIRAFSAMQLDMYPKGSIAAQPYREGQNPFEIAEWFDSGNYTINRNLRFGNLWIQGGSRARMFFADNPAAAPALNKNPLVRWSRNYVYASSTHMLLPRGLNNTFESGGGEKTSGCLLHGKFLDTIASKTDAEMARSEHYDSGLEYKAYQDGLQSQSDLWCKWSERYINWRQLEILGLMSKGNWA